MADQLNQTCGLHDVFAKTIENCCAEVKKKTPLWAFIGISAVMLTMVATLWTFQVLQQQAATEIRDIAKENSIMIKTEFHHVGQQIASMRTRLDALLTKQTQQEIERLRRDRGDFYYQPDNHNFKPE